LHYGAFSQGGAMNAGAGGLNSALPICHQMALGQSAGSSVDVCTVVETWASASHQCRQGSPKTRERGELETLSSAGMHADMFFVFQKTPVLILVCDPFVPNLPGFWPERKQVWGVINQTGLLPNSW